MVTEQGFLKLDGKLTRTGVLEYQQPDGSVFRELRHPDEVFKKDSLDSLKLCPVTDLHQAMVDPSNVSVVSVGVVGGDVRKDGKFVVGSVTIQRKDAIEAVQGGTRRELSPGYRCWVDQTPGEYDGERYDGVQRDIIYNHLAVGPENWGRSGPEVALRLDGNGDQCVETLDSGSGGRESVGRLNGGQPAETRNDMKIKIVLDGKTYEVEAQEGVGSLLTSALGEQSGRLDAATGELEKLQGRLDAADKELKEVQAKLDSATDPKSIEAAVEARSTLIAEAGKVAPDAKFDGLTAEEIRVTALVASGVESDRLDGKSADYVSGLFEGALVTANRTDSAEAALPSGGAKSVAAATPDTRTDAKPDTAEAAQHRSQVRNTEAWNKASA